MFEQYGVLNMVQDPVHEQQNHDRVVELPEHGNKIRN